MDPQEIAKREAQERQTEAVYLASLMAKCGGLKAGERFRTTEGLQTVDLKVVGDVNELDHVPCVNEHGDKFHVKATKMVRKLT